MEEIIKKIKKSMFIGEDSPDFLDSNYKVFELKKENFEYPKDSKTMPLVFLDGGTQELFSSPNFGLFFNRIFYCIYEGKKMLKRKKYEFYSLISTKINEGNIFFSTELFFLKDSFQVQKMEFSIKDETLRFGKNIVEIPYLANNVRKLLEIKVASLIDDKDLIIVLDRDMHPKITYEDILFKELHENTLKRRNIICALSKTSSLLTKKGNSVSAILNLMGPKKEWLYKVAETEDFDVYFVKLNPNSEYVFRIDIAKCSDKNLIINNLVLNSNDPVFLGYPYGLVKADSNARVSNKESEFLKMQLITKFGDDFRNFKKYIQSKDAHTILDNIR